MAKLLRLALVTAAFSASCAFATSASAFLSSCSGEHPCDIGNQIVISGQVRVGPGESAKQVVILNGDVQIDGTVRKSAFALNGDILVRGRVAHEVIALNGRVRVADGGYVGGDISSREKAIIGKDATVRGSVDRVEGRLALGQLAWVGRIALWIAITVSVFALGAALLLIAPRALEATARAGRTAIGPR